VTRGKGGAWSLDEVENLPAVTRDAPKVEGGRIEGKSIAAKPEGVLIHGLFIEGAGWNKQ